MAQGVAKRNYKNMSFVTPYGLAIGIWGFLFLFWFLETIAFRTQTPNNHKNLRVRWPINIVFGLINGALMPAIPVSVTMAAMWAKTNNFGVLNQFELPLWVIIIMSVLLASLYQYGFHRLMHHIPVLWRIHRVHHSDEYLDSSTAFRFHPFELIIGIAIGVSFVTITGIDARVLTIFAMVEAVFGIATHTSLKWPSFVEKYVRIFIITPSLHHLHHAEVTAYANKNFGAVFPLWDQVFGTYHHLPTQDIQKLVIGVNEVSPNDAVSFDWLATSPWRVLPIDTDRH